MTIQHLKQILLQEGAEEYPNLERIENGIADYKFKNDVIRSNEDKVLQFIERTFNLVGCFKNKSRIKKFVFARYCFFWYLYEIKGYTLTKIGHNYGFDHATVIYGRNAIEENHRTLDYHKEIKKIKEILS